MDKVVVLDTNVLIDNPRAIFSFPDSLVVIPSIVIDELDNLKNNKDGNVRRMARIAANFIDEITENYEESDKENMVLDNGGELLIDDLSAADFNTPEPTKPDNIIIATALKYTKKGSVKEVVMYSNDTNVRNKTRVQARAQDLKEKIKARKFSLIDASLHEIDSGVQDLFIPDEDIFQLRREGYINIELPYINGEHILVRSEINPEKNTALAQWDSIQKRVIVLPDYKKKSLWQIGGNKLEGSTAVTPRDSRQTFLAHDILNTDKNLHFVLSRVAGAGKNFITTACALSLLKMGHYDRLIIIKPMISVEGSDTGYLPGTKEEKMAPWFESFNDTITELTNDRGLTQELEAKIELDIVTHMRGRSIPRTIMIIDEAQNFSEEALKTLGSRAGEGSKIILMGDLSQIDNPRLDSGNNGLRVWAERARHKESGYAGSTYILLDSNFRSELSAWFSSFYE
jgi:PhoH-like ATPase